MVQISFLCFPILYASSKKSFTQRSLRWNVFVLIFDNMVLYVVGLRKSKALKEDFGKYLAPKWCWWGPAGVFKSTEMPSSQWFQQIASLHWFLTLFLRAEFILCSFWLKVGQVLTSHCRKEQNHWGFTARSVCWEFSTT